jgi:DNA topoisomerase-1
MGQQAKLVYVSDEEPGWGRKRSGKGFSYTDLKSSTIKDKNHLARLKALAVPPAWTDVWLCPQANGHILATGRDERGRKQYIYHPEWHQTQTAAKFDHMIIFGTQLPRIRRRVGNDLKRPGLPQDKVIAAVVKLLETTLIRVGNASYAKENNSFGLTTLRKKHVEVSGTTLDLEFNGKSGKAWDVTLHDAQLAKVIKRCEDIPGYRLFKYYDAHGTAQSVDSSDVNAYLKTITHEDITAKDFRTWAGTILTTFGLAELEEPESKAKRTSNVVSVIKDVAHQLGNTPAVCRKSYVHPHVIDCYLEGTLVTLLKKAENARTKSVRGLRKQEQTMLAFLRMGF